MGDPIAELSPCLGIETNRNYPMVGGESRAQRSDVQEIYIQADCVVPTLGGSPHRSGTNDVLSNL